MSPMCLFARTKTVFLSWCIMGYMNLELRVCQSCTNQFAIQPEDFEYYKKIEVPAPTFCFECRMKQLMLWRNERTLYKNKDFFTGEEIISIFHPDSPFRPVSQKNWWQDSWDATEHGTAYDFEKPFFVQFRELLEKMPLVALFNQRAVNSDYCNHCDDSKNCYLTFGSIWNENVAYSRGAVRSKDSLDILHGENVEQCFDSLDLEACYRTFFSQECVNCTDSAFLFDCRGCTSCVGCAGLRNKSYCILNEQLTKEEYKKRLQELRLGTRRGIEDFQKKFEALKKTIPRKYANISQSENVVGDHVSHAKNCYYSFDVYQNTADCRYIVHGGSNLFDSFDSYGMGEGELMYKVVDTGIESSRIFFSVVVRSSRDVSYAYYCHNSSNLFGCIGLRNKQYCILNKQYTKEEYEELLPKIKRHMEEMPFVDAKGVVYRYGDFFPTALSPFAYNETLAQEYFPLGQKEAEEQGHRWQTSEKKNRDVSLSANEVPDDIEKVNEEILQQTIGCAHREECHEQCTGAFRITASDFQFYKRMNLPLPRLCPNCRHYQRLTKRNRMKLWTRECVCEGKKGGEYQNTGMHFHGEEKCPNRFQTSYAPGREEIVYCEQCYNSEIL